MNDSNVSAEGEKDQHEAFRKAVVLDGNVAIEGGIRLGAK
jgi:hypothetical protein